MTEADLAAIRALLAEHRQEERADSAAQHAENQTRMDMFDRELKAVSGAIKTAFPDGDLDGHRRYHELLIEEALERKQMRAAIKTHVLKSSTWAVIVGLLGLLWLGLLRKLGVGQ